MWPYRSPSPPLEEPPRPSFEDAAFVEALKRSGERNARVHHVLRIGGYVLATACVLVAIYASLTEVVERRTHCAEIGVTARGESVYRCAP